MVRRWVEFLVRPSGEKKYRPMKLRIESFLHRFLQHVLPTGLQKGASFWVHAQALEVESNLVIDARDGLA